ncbi:MAG: TAT-variant-translocated molybdopterin oxidoreductase, partial [Pirellulaceae bacterium]
MSSLDKARLSKTHWRSLAELADSPRFRAFAEAEFPELSDPSGMSRRRWLQLMGASLTLAGASGCYWDTEEIVPFARRPDDRVPGEMEFFATAMELGGSTFGLLVTSRDGRPIKVEGNPDHPDSLGAAHAFAQASVLQLYDPDRSRNVQDMGSKATRTWDEFLAFAEPHFAKLKAGQGRGLAFLAEPSSSPTRAVMRSRIRHEFPQARWYEYTPLTTDHAREGSRLAFGKPYRVDFALDRASVLLCLDCDLLGSHPAAFRYARQFAKAREPRNHQMSRLYAVESRFSITGSHADHRLPIASRDIASFVAGLEIEIERLSAAGDPGEHRAEDERAGLGNALAGDLWSHRGQCVVAVGPSQPPEVHAAAARLNHALGNSGKTVWYREEPEPDRPAHVEAIRSLAAGMNQGQVETLVVLGGNPVYNAPADLAFAEAYGKVPSRIHLSRYIDETSRASTWHLSQSHFLESWGDGRAFDGTYTLQQPLIAPLYGGRSTIELLDTLLGNRAPDGLSLVKTTFAAQFGEQDLESKWARAVHDGIVSGSHGETATPEPAEGRIAAAGESQELELVFCESASVYDGRFANSGWLQETPDPMTKITWDNAAILNPETAHEKGIETDTLVRLSVGGRELEMVAYLLPGQARNSVTVAIGYGRAAAGQVGGDHEMGVPAVG